MTYEEALVKISELPPRGIRLGLERMKAFCQSAGIELQGEIPRFIQVAGTNGKGSVTACLQSLFLEAGFNTGAYFSPYVYDPRERIQLGRNLISEEEFAALTTALFEFVPPFENSEYGGISEFEFKTAMGLLAFQQNKCERVALEVGLGGTYDATSVVHPACGVIVSIGLDHTHILGDTLDKIAAEKAGILKPEMPLVLGEMPAEASETILSHARALNCPVWQLGKEIRLTGVSEYTVELPTRTISGLKPGLHGVKQPENMALAIAAGELSGCLEGVPDEVLVRGIRNTTIPGRFERIQKAKQLFVLDGAHNGEAAATLAASLLAEREGQWVLVLSMLHGHDVERFLKPFAENNLVSECLVLPLDNPRAMPANDIAKVCEQYFPTRVFQTAEQAIEYAQETQQNVVVTGSFYLLGPMKEALMR